MDKNDRLIVHGEVPPRFGLVINGDHQPRVFKTVEEAEAEIKRLKRFDKRIEIYDGHLRKIVPRLTSKK